MSSCINNYVTQCLAEAISVQNCTDPCSSLRSQISDMNKTHLITVIMFGVTLMFLILVVVCNNNMKRKY